MALQNLNLETYTQFKEKSSAFNLAKIIQIKIGHLTK